MLTHTQTDRHTEMSTLYLHKYNYYTYYLVYCGVQTLHIKDVCTLTSHILRYKFADLIYNFGIIEWFTKTSCKAFLFKNLFRYSARELEA